MVSFNNLHASSNFDQKLKNNLLELVCVSYRPNKTFMGWISFFEKSKINLEAFPILPWSIFNPKIYLFFSCYLQLDHLY
jgi:hypothetical protein